MQRQVQVQVIRPGEYPNEGPQTDVHVKLNFCLLQSYFPEPIRTDQKQCIAMAIRRILEERLKAGCVEEDLEEHDHLCHVVQMTFHTTIDPTVDVESVDFTWSLFNRARELLKLLSRVAWPKIIVYPFETEEYKLDMLPQATIHLYPY